jgi:hypothetical protein
VHSNGHGCDDIIHGDGATHGPGGPVGCTVGNSGDHRQNGASGGDATSTATPTTSDASPAAATPDDTSRGNGKSNGNNGNGTGGNNGNGNGHKPK